MVTGKTLTSVLAALALYSVTSCATPTKPIPKSYHSPAYSTNVSESELKPSGMFKSQDIIIGCTPECTVYVNDQVIGEKSVGGTPLKFSFRYPVMNGERTTFYKQGSVIKSIEEESVVRDGKAAYKVKATKSDYISQVREVKVPDTQISRLEFVLERKESVKVEDVKIKKHVKLQAWKGVVNKYAHKVFKTPTLEGSISAENLNPDAVSKAFIPSNDKKSKYVIGGEAIVEHDVTTVTIYLNERGKGTVAAKTGSVSTGTPTMDILNNLAKGLTSEMINSFLNRDKR